jgi:hypothetical protein
MTIDVESLPAAAMCTVCKAIKPLAEFKAKATKAQSKAWGFAGNVTLEYESSRCKPCQPKKKPLEKLRRDELLAKAKSGELSDFIVDSEIKRREASRASKGRDAITKRWGKVFRESWDEMLKPLLSEIKLVRRQLTRHESRLLESQCGATLMFLRTYLDVLVEVEALAKLERLKEQRRADSARWQMFVSFGDTATLGTMWRNLPYKEHMKLRLPTLWTTDPAR